MHVLHAAEAGRGKRAAMISEMTANELVFLWLAADVPIVARHADYGVIRLGSGIGEKEMVEVPRCDL